MRITTTNTVLAARVLRTAHAIAKCTLSLIEGEQIANTGSTVTLTRADLNLAVDNLRLLADTVEAGNIADTAQAAEQVMCVHMTLMPDRGPRGVLHAALGVAGRDPFRPVWTTNDVLEYADDSGIRTAIQLVALRAIVEPEKSIDLSPAADMIGFPRSHWALFARLIRDGNTTEDALVKTELLTDPAK